MHGGGIDVHMVERNVRKLIGHDAGGHRTPQTRSFHHIRFVD